MTDSPFQCPATPTSSFTHHPTSSLQFAFILPLIFYNKYIDDSRWESRFQLMTLQVMSVPLQLGGIFVLNRWRRTRIDGRRWTS